MGVLPDVLVGDGTRIFMRSRGFREQLRAGAGKPEVKVDGGYLEDSYFKRTPWRTGAGEYGRVIVHDSQSAYYVRQFDYVARARPDRVLHAGQEGLSVVCQ